MAKQEKILTPEEKERKDRLRFRLFIIVIIIDVILAGYLVYEMVSVFTNNGTPTTSQSAVAIQQIINLLK